MRYIFLCLIILLAPTHWAHGFKESLTRLIDRYERPVTILEISGSNYYYTQAHQEAKVISVLLPAQEDHLLLQKLLQEGQKQTILLSSRMLTLPHLERLARCEFPDITIINNFSGLLTKTSAWLATFMRLSDFLCIESEPKIIDQICERQAQYLYERGITGSRKAFCLLKTPKKGLDIARWNLDNQPVARVPRYRVASDFAEKKLCKPEQITIYVPGFNLLTCLMLECRYPTYAMLYDKLSPLQYIEHEDLVLGNLILQGTSLVPIDFNDKRRKSNARHCVKAALRFLAHPYKDQHTLKKALKRYEKRVQKRSRS
jgi:hypothetical protein